MNKNITYKYCMLIAIRHRISIFFCVNEYSKVEIFTRTKSEMLFVFDKEVREFFY